MGGVYRRVWVLGCGVAVMEQVTHDSRCDGGGAGVAGDDGGGGRAAKGAWAAVLVRMEAGTRAGAWVSGGVNDPDVCGLWFQESLPLCMVITSSVLFSAHFDSGVVL